MLRFPFDLQPIAECPPWGDDRPTLHWFGLTSGWYWIATANGELLRYHDRAVRRWGLPRPYPDYHVARQWEDVLDLRWALQENVPDDLLSFVDGTFADRELPDEVDATADAAFGLRSDLVLDLGHLTGAPVVRCWRHRAGGQDAVTISQQIAPENRDVFDGPARLDTTVPAAEFFAAVEDFDRRFIAAMGERVTEVERTGPPPGIALDVPGLRAEHTQRSGRLERRLATPRRTDWPPYEPASPGSHHGPRTREARESDRQRTRSHPRRRSAASTATSTREVIPATSTGRRPAT